MTGSALERLLGRDRAIVAAALAAITVLAWLYVLRLAADMDMGGMPMDGMRMTSTGLRMIMAPASAPWSGTEFLLMFVMWTVMMVGMMTPSVAPLVLLYARVGRQAALDEQPFAATAWFAGGYLSCEQPAGSQWMRYGRSRHPRSSHAAVAFSATGDNGIDDVSFSTRPPLC